MNSDQKNVEKPMIRFHGDTGYPSFSGSFRKALLLSEENYVNIQKTFLDLAVYAKQNTMMFHLHRRRSIQEIFY